MLIALQSPNILFSLFPYCGLVMKAITIFVFIISFFSIFPTSAQEATPEATTQNKAFISDELFIYMHTGAGKNYRILGSINAGDEIVLTGEQANDFTQITDEKNRTGWIESRYVSTNPSLRSVIAELNGTLAANSEKEQNLNITIEDKQSQIDQLTAQSTSLQDELSALTQAHEALKLKVDNQDLELKKQYFFYGAMVLGIGLLLGIILPHLAAKKKKTQSWN